MLIAIPVSHVELNKAQELVDWMGVIGPFRGHQVLLSATQSASDKLHHLEEKLKTIFDKVHVFTLPTRNERPWPVCANHHFKCTANEIFTGKYADYWYWSECDNIPLDASWLTSLENEYKFHRLPFLGTMHDTYRRYPDGHMERQGRHLNGNAIYPKILPQVIPIFRYLDEVPFDIFFQYYMVNPAKKLNLVRDTDMCHNAWQSQNFRRDENSDLIYDRTEAGNMLPGGKVQKSAKVVHGCKDSSLINLLYKERKCQNQMV